MKKENIIDIITDEDGRKIVVITDIRFKGKRNIDWEDVENYLKEYVGKCYEVVETADQVFIGNDFPAELKGSEDTKRLCGANVKANRANENCVFSSLYHARLCKIRKGKITGGTRK